MVKLTIDNISVEVKENTTILEACKENNIYIPTLCYLKDINEIGACRVCLVEVENEEKLVASCNTICENDMVVKTNSERVINARKANVELILSKHDFDCENCKRENTCQLQKVSKELGIEDKKYFGDILPSNWDQSIPLIRNDSKCIGCLRCVSECQNVQSMKVWEVNGTGERTKVEVRDGEYLLDINCALCGQCVTHCPTAALTERDDVDKVLDAISDKDKVTVVQIAPAVRSAFSDMFDLDFELNSEKKMVAAIKSMGVDYVFDTNFSADLTIMEETSELLEFLVKRQNDFPMFTSCCPGWVRFMKSEYPDMVKYLSTSKSPQQMFGAVTKSYFVEKMGIDKDKIVCISIMPCVAKKYECDVKAVNDASSKDVDIVLTTRELGRLLKDVDIKNIEGREFDSPLGEHTGAAVIFGTTGGVMEAALRTAYNFVAGENPPLDAFLNVRAVEMDDFKNATWREAEYDIKGTKVRVAVASSLQNARALVQAIVDHKVKYDFVEVMACPGGCSGGGGQPIKDNEEQAIKRGKRLYEFDEDCEIRFSHENPEIITLYNEYLEKPLSEKAEKLLHTDQDLW